MSTLEMTVPSAPPDGCDASIETENIQGNSGGVVPCRINPKGLCHLSFLKRVGMIAHVVRGHCPITQETPPSPINN